MLFSQLLSVAAALLLGTVFVQAQIAPGKYRIWIGNQSARSFPGAGHQGPFQVEITMSDQFASIYEQWNVIRNGDSYIIQSAATSAKAYADPAFNNQVFAASNKQTSWFIENKGSNGTDTLYAIKVPYQDLLWTNTNRPSRDNAIFLTGSSGSPTQRFVFQPV